MAEDWREIHRRVIGGVDEAEYTRVNELRASDPGSIQAVSDAYTRPIGTSLAEAREQLRAAQHELVGAGGWSGRAADAFDALAVRLDRSVAHLAEPLTGSYGYERALSRAAEALRAAVRELEELNHWGAQQTRARYEALRTAWNDSLVVSPRGAYSTTPRPEEPWFTNSQGRTVYTPSAYPDIDQQMTERANEIYDRLVTTYRGSAADLAPPSGMPAIPMPAGAQAFDPTALPQGSDPGAVPDLGLPGAGDVPSPGSGMPGGVPPLGEAPPVPGAPGGASPLPGAPGIADLPGAATGGVPGGGLPGLPGTGDLTSPPGVPAAGAGLPEAPPVPGLDPTTGSPGAGPFAAPFLPASPALGTPTGGSRRSAGVPPTGTVPPLPGAPPVPDAPGLDDLGSPPAGPAVPGADELSRLAELPPSPAVPGSPDGPPLPGSRADLPDLAGLPGGSAAGGLAVSPLPEAPAVTGGSGAGGLAVSPLPEAPAVPGVPGAIDGIQPGSGGGSVGASGGGALPQAPPVGDSFPFAGGPAAAAPAGADGGLGTLPGTPGGGAAPGLAPPSGIATPDGAPAGGSGYGGMPFMPMAPMAGAGAAGAGRGGEERERTTWLQEDRPIWATSDDDCAPAVLRSAQVGDAPDSVDPVPATDPRRPAGRPGAPRPTAPAGGYTYGR